MNSRAALTCVLILTALSPGCGGRSASVLRAPTGDGGATPAPDSAGLTGFGPPRVLANKLDVPGSLAVDATHVYWTTRTRVMRVARQGGQVVSLATGQSFPSAVGVNSSHAFWIAANSPSGGSSLLTAPRAGGTPKRLASWTHHLGDRSGGPARLAVDGARLFWPAWRKLMTMTVGQSAAVVSTEAKLSVLAVDMDSTWVYWSTSPFEQIHPGEPGQVKRAHRGGQAHQMTLVASGATGVVRADGAHVYYLTDRGVARVPGSGGAAIRLATGVDPAGLAVRDGWVYWTDRGKGTVSRVRATGDAAETLASGQHTPTWVVVDAGGLFWISQGLGATGQVMTRPRR